MIKIAVNQSGSISMIPLNGAQIRTKAGWTPIKPTDKIYLNGQWYTVGSGEPVVGEVLSPDYTGNLLLNITTDDGTVLKTLTLIYEGISYDTSRWETAGDDLGTCYCGTGCCDAVYLQYAHDKKNWFTECYVGEEGGCWQWTGTELILGKNLVTSIETGKPQSVVITKA